MGIHLDINFNFKTEGFKRIADTVAPFNLTWLEIDTHDAPALAEIKRGAPCPIASCETLHGRREFKPFFDNYATDVAIVDVIWNGLNELLKIASMADVYEINVAPHNFYGHLCSAISATFSAIVPNFRVMEIDIDSAPWRDEFYVTVPTIENGEFVLPKGPGWGIDVNEKAVRARPPKNTQTGDWRDGTNSRSRRPPGQASPSPAAATTWRWSRWKASTPRSSKARPTRTGSSSSPRMPMPSMRRASASPRRSSTACRSGVAASCSAASASTAST